jgi:hypothetical protein
VIQWVIHFCRPAAKEDMSGTDAFQAFDIIRLGAALE